MVRAVVFDVGETLVDETRYWAGWADWLGISHLTFFSVLGQAADRGEHHRRVFEILCPEVDIELEKKRRAAAGHVDEHRADDLYPDAVDCMRELKQRGFWIGVAGNQPAHIEHNQAFLGLQIDGIASSGSWGVEKPSAEFFARIVEFAGFSAGEIAYVGDRLDNDVLPAAEAGLMSVFLVRGPWGYAHVRRPEAARADLCLRDLAALPGALENWSVARA